MNPGGKTTAASNAKARIAKLQWIYDGLREGTVVVERSTITEERHLGELPAVTEYVKMCDLPMRPYLYDLLRVAADGYKAHCEASFSLACLQQNVIDRPLRIMIWLGLSEKSAPFVEKWEKKLHEFSLHFTQMQHNRLQDEEYQFNHAKSKVLQDALIKCGMSDEEFALLWKVIWEWKESITRTGMACDRLAQCVASYGCTAQQRIAARGKPPMTIKPLDYPTTPATLSGTGQAAVKEIWHGLRRLSE